MVEVQLLCLGKSRHQAIYAPRSVFAHVPAVLEGLDFIVHIGLAVGLGEDIIYIRSGADAPESLSVYIEATVLLAFLGGDYDDTVGRAGTPYTGSRGILQYGDALHVVRIDAAEGAFDGESVHDDERRGVGIERGGTTNLEIYRTILVLRSLHTGYQTLQGCRKVGGRTGGKFLFANLVERTCGTFAGELLIACYHHIVQCVVFVIQHDVQAMTASLAVDALLAYV